MPRNSKCVYPYPVYEGHFADGSVVRMSFWTPINKPIDFTIGQIHCELYKLAPVIDGFVEHNCQPAYDAVSNMAWSRVRDPHFSGEPVETVKPRINGARLKKAALMIVEQSANGGITPKAMQDLREALNLAA